MKSWADKNVVPWLIFQESNLKHNDHLRKNLLEICSFSFYHILSFKIGKTKNWVFLWVSSLICLFLLISWIKWFKIVIFVKKFNFLVFFFFWYMGFIIIQSSLVFHYWFILFCICWWSSYSFHVWLITESR